MQGFEAHRSHRSRDQRDDAPQRDAVLPLRSVLDPPARDSAPSARCGPRPRGTTCRSSAKGRRGRTTADDLVTLTRPRVRDANRDARPRPAQPGVLGRRQRRYQAAHGDGAARRAARVGRVPHSRSRARRARRRRADATCSSSAAARRNGRSRWRRRAHGWSGSTCLDAQLAHARSGRCSGSARAGERRAAPVRDGAFDIVFCDHGAISFCDPSVIIPETARLLRPNGLLAFCVVHPLLYLTWDEERQRQTRRLQIDYDELGRMELGEGTIDWALPAGQWIDVLRAHGFTIEASSSCARRRARRRRTRSSPRRNGRGAGRRSGSGWRAARRELRGAQTGARSWAMNDARSAA